VSERRKSPAALTRLRAGWRNLSPLLLINLGFSLNAVADPVLRRMLAQTPHFEKSPNCNEGPDARWVFFEANGNFASGIFRIFT
jgi:hypothetical protein